MTPFIGLRVVGRCDSPSGNGGFADGQARSGAGAIGDAEWTVIAPLLPPKGRGVARVAAGG
jgi:hypothetical protein